MFGISGWMKSWEKTGSEKRWPAYGNFLSALGGNWRKDFREDVQNIRNAERLLKVPGFGRQAGAFSGHQISGHENDFGLVIACGDLQALRHAISVGVGSGTG